MKRFKHKILYCEIGSKRSYREMDELLDRYSAEGWEVVSAMVNGDGFTTFLKRETSRDQSREHVA